MVPRCANGYFLYYDSAQCASMGSRLVSSRPKNLVGLSKDRFSMEAWPCDMPIEKGGDILFYQGASSCTDGDAHQEIVCVMSYGCSTRSAPPVIGVRDYAAIRDYIYSDWDLWLAPSWTGCSSVLFTITVTSQTIFSYFSSLQKHVESFLWADTCSRLSYLYE